MEETTESSATVDAGRIGFATKAGIVGAFIGGGIGLAVAASLVIQLLVAGLVGGTLAVGCYGALVWLSGRYPTQFGASQSRPIAPERLTTSDQSTAADRSTVSDRSTPSNRQQTGVDSHRAGAGQTTAADGGEPIDL